MIDKGYSAEEIDAACDRIVKRTSRAYVMLSSEINEELVRGRGSGFIKRDCPCVDDEGNIWQEAGHARDYARAHPGCLPLTALIPTTTAEQLLMDLLSAQFFTQIACSREINLAFATWLRAETEDIQ